MNIEMENDNTLKIDGYTFDFEPSVFGDGIVIQIAEIFDNTEKAKGFVKENFKLSNTKDKELTNGQILDLIKPYFNDAFINSNNELIRVMNYKELTTEELREEAKKIEVNYMIQKTELEKVYYSRYEVIISAFGSVLNGIDKEKHPYLSDVIGKIDWCKEISGNVETYRTKVPFEGLKIVSKNKEYTIMYQGDSDYSHCFDSFCEGNKPEINRSSSNLWNVEQDMINDTYGMSIDELEDYFVSKKDYLENQEEGSQFFHIEILTILHSISCM